MKKFFLILFAVIGFVLIADAQDVITLKNGTDINALVQQIGEVEIEYKKIENPNGPNYTLKKSEILMIRYENGTKDIFSVEPTSVENNDNSSINTNFSLRKSSKIILDIDLSKSQKRKMYALMEDRLRKLGFCCIYNALDEITSTANIVIDLHPVAASCFRIQIFDKTLDRKVFDNRYTYWTTFDKVIDNFINDIIHFVEK